MQPQTPARRDPLEARSQESDAVATTGGPVTFTLPPSLGLPQFCGGKSLNDGVPVRCGSSAPHMPHRLT